jgi:hypothetical protein
MELTARIQKENVFSSRAAAKAIEKIVNLLINHTKPCEKLVWEY